MAFFQDPPRLTNTFREDPMLGAFLRHRAPTVAAELEPELAALGELAIELHAQSLRERALEPVHTPWDAWGARIDHIEVTPLWHRGQQLAATHGFVAKGYEARLGRHARLAQFATVHVGAPSLDVYGCPLAMTDGAAKTLLASGNQALIERLVPRLVTRDPGRMWTSGQWMTERTGGSDVSLTQTTARRTGDADDAPDAWALSGTKWFTSATTADIAITLARPDGNPDGSRGLALFVVEPRDATGRLRGITVNRLKDKLGTRKVPTAELTLAGTPATLVAGRSDGVRGITPMLSVTRTWNAVSAIGMMRRGLALARDYAQRRVAFGAALADKPLHRDTLAELEAQYAGAFVLAFRTVEALGASEHGDAGEEALLRVLTPIAKLTTAKQAVEVLGEVIEAFGGAGYVEDTGLPRLLADAHVLPIWEGTTNVLALDTLRALAKDGWATLHGDARAALAADAVPELAAAADVARVALDHAAAWLDGNRTQPARLEAGARRFALTVGRALELAYLCRHAAACTDVSDRRWAIAAARRLALGGLDRICADADAPDDAAVLLGRRIAP